MVGWGMAGVHHVGLDGCGDPRLEKVGLGMAGSDHVSLEGTEVQAPKRLVGGCWGQCKSARVESSRG